MKSIKLHSQIWMGRGGGGSCLVDRARVCAFYGEGDFLTPRLGIRLYLAKTNKTYIFLSVIKIIAFLQP